MDAHRRLADTEIVSGLLHEYVFSAIFYVSFIFLPDLVWLDSISQFFSVVFFFRFHDCINSLIFLSSLNTKTSRTKNEERKNKPTLKNNSNYVRLVVYLLGVGEGALRRLNDADNDAKQTECRAENFDDENLDEHAVFLRVRQSASRTRDTDANTAREQKHKTAANSNN